jgi:hypothetical protein
LARVGTIILGCGVVPGTLVLSPLRHSAFAFFLRRKNTQRKWLLLPSSLRASARLQRLVMAASEWDVGNKTLHGDSHGRLDDGPVGEAAAVCDPNVKQQVDANVQYTVAVYCLQPNLRPPLSAQCQSSCQIAATPLVGQQIQRPAPSAALAAATYEADRVLNVAYI